ncbi:MAG: hypothetical protein DDT19_02998 [Syntrophomonadaceae bacterium]|nr:hypothetical protein [Bacillota bacterium]
MVDKRKMKEAIQFWKEMGVTFRKRRLSPHEKKIRNAMKSAPCDAQGNREYFLDCGCYGSSGGGAYGTPGSVWAHYPCHMHG